MRKEGRNGERDADTQSERETINKGYVRFKKTNVGGENLNCTCRKTESCTRQLRHKYALFDYCALCVGTCFLDFSRDQIMCWRHTSKYKRPCDSLLLLARWKMCGVCIFVFEQTPLFTHHHSTVIDFDAEHKFLPQKLSISITHGILCICARCLMTMTSCG